METLNKPAILGGSKVKNSDFPPHITTDELEVKAVNEVAKSGVFSYFIAGNRPEFHGGPKVQELEQLWSDRFKVKYAVSMNSATSCLFAAIGAIGIGPGDEVITTPWTMSATVAAILAYNAIPVFADIEDETFNIDPKDVERKITPQTKAIMPVHLAGHPARMKPLLELAKKHNLKIIEDTAQSPGALSDGEICGTQGDIGVYSLNTHKAIQAGEGGVAVTNDKELAYRMKLIRNHAEMGVACGHTPASLANMLGWNYRMTELEASISIEQLKKLDKINSHRQELAGYLTEKLSKIEGITPPIVRDNCTHVYYFYPIKIDTSVVGMKRDNLVDALNAEGLPFRKGYGKPIYQYPIFQEKILYGGTGCPFSCPMYKGKVKYEKGMCKVVEDLEENKLFWTGLIRQPLTLHDMDFIHEAFNKIITHKVEIKEYFKKQSNDVEVVEEKKWW